jgi:hypothetical protein
MLTVIAHTRLITPVNLGVFCFSLRLDGRISFIQPLLHRFWILLIGALDRLLRGKTPALQILPNGSNRHPDTGFLFNQLHYRLARPQRISHLELIRCLVHDLFADHAFLRCAQMTCLTELASTPIHHQFALAEL